MIVLIWQIVAPQAKMFELLIMTVDLSFIHPQLVGNSAEFGLMVDRMKPSVANHMEQTTTPGQYIERMLILESE
jgi:hypothetical protein